MATIERFLPESRERDHFEATEIKKYKKKKRERNKEESTGLQPRRILGLFLVIASFLGVLITVTKSDQRQTVLALVHDMAPGQTITSGDVEAIKAALPDGLYAVNRDELIGKALAAPVKAGEVIPLSQIVPTDQAELVAVPIKSINLPPLSRGDQVSLWSEGQLVASNLAVESIVRESTHQVITVRVSKEMTPSVVAALAGELVLVKLP